MLNLIKKDLIITKSYIIKMLAFLILFSFLFNNIDKRGLCVFCIYAVVNIFISISFTYGEKAKEDYMLRSFPIKKNEVVLAKYTSVIIYFIAALILIYIVCFIVYILNFKYIIQIPKVTTILFSLSMIFISMAIQLPISFKLNYSKARILNGFIYCGTFGFLVSIYESNMDIIKLTFNNKVGLLSVILFIISAILSMKIYENKESM
ncbi:ABC-2 transporter permease [Clostridium sporogenes]|uniref:ABC-2 transporter permease n=1 Tax=Clostridium sporogenes TaxID=1509 RepID=UPI0013D3D4AF|nr:ABC-2 transporter permease [Clostridium sporogenes]NFE79784.1 ABC-2 transporter permease [Clostridium sporogenes]NFG69129.1 ABC-2 transporter permease [Clostridium sporogenes]